MKAKCGVVIETGVTGTAGGALLARRPSGSRPGVGPEGVARPAEEIVGAVGSRDDEHADDDVPVTPPQPHGHAVVPAGAIAFASAGVNVPRTLNASAEPAARGM